MYTLTIILDTNEFIYGITNTKEVSTTLLASLSGYNVKVPRIILDELHRNLQSEPLKELYRLLRDSKAEIIDEKIPVSLVKKYEEEIPYEDAVIASYCEFLSVDFFISENRHFLSDFQPKAFKVLSASDFLKKFP